MQKQMNRKAKQRINNHTDQIARILTQAVYFSTGHCSDGIGPVIYLDDEAKTR